jgi:hypothetical protein
VTVTGTTAGSVTIRAIYSGDTVNSAAAGSTSLTVSGGSEPQDSAHPLLALLGSLVIPVGSSRIWSRGRD